MRIIIDCDQFTIEDVKALGCHLRERYAAQEEVAVAMQVLAPDMPAREAMEAVQEMFPPDGPSFVTFLPPEARAR